MSAPRLAIRIRDERLAPEHLVVYAQQAPPLSLRNDGQGRRMEFIGHSAHPTLAAPPLKKRVVATGDDRKEAGYPRRVCDCCNASFKPRGSVQDDCQTCIDRIPKRLRSASGRIPYAGVRASLLMPRPPKAAGKFNCRNLEAASLRKNVEGLRAVGFDVACPDGVS